MSNNILVAFLVLNSLLIGYLFGRFTANNGVITNSPQSFFKHQKDQKERIVNNLSIDDKKFVVDIKTDGMERKYDNLGDIKQTEENISNSVNKLKNLKR